MGEFIYFVLMALFAPLLSVVLVSFAIIYLHSLLKKMRPDFSRVWNAFLSTLLLEIQALFLALIMGILFGSSISGFAYFGAAMLLFCTTLVGIGGFIYFVFRGAPAWCQWGTWRGLLWPSR